MADHVDDFLNPQKSLGVLELDVLRSFIAIVESGNFSRAAEIVHRTPSAVSMQMKKLEDQLGVRLLARDSRSVALTVDGEMLLPYARRLIELNNEALTAFSGQALEGVVRVGAPDNIADDILPEVLRRIGESHPNVRLEVKIDLSSNLLKGLSQRQFDLVLFTCFRDGTNIPPGGEIIFTEPLVWAGAKGGTAHLRDPLPVSMWDEPCTLTQAARQALTNSGRSFSIPYQSQYIGAQKAAIRADMVISPLGLSQVDGDLSVLSEHDGVPELGENRIGMVTKEDTSLLIDHVAEYFRIAFRSFERASQIPSARVA
jgi:DNA-binding transcriptional LysR family regulator